jgi:hypothetical protein
MMSYDTMLAVISWEERFELGINRFLNSNSVKQIFLFDFVDYIENTRKNIERLKENIDKQKVEIKIIQLKHNDNINNWKIIKDNFINLEGSLVIDISTMPRDIIYYSLYHAENSDKINSLFCIYNRPEGYSSEKWLTSDPGKPQLVYNMSGISEMDKDTILIILTGFDQKRLEQLLNYYEPKKVYLGIQTGEQYENNILNAEKHIKFTKSFLNIECFDLDAYLEEDYGFSKTEEKIIENKDSNIILASLGPKPSSIALFRLNKKYPSVGLIYVPVAKYNMDYSFGIDKTEPVFEKIK